MADINVETDLQAVTEKMEVLVTELNKVNAHREQIVSQVQNLQGVIMYLRGKTEAPSDIQIEGEENLPPEGMDAAQNIIDANSNKAGDKKGS